MGVTLCSRRWLLLAGMAVLLAPVAADAASVSWNEQRSIARLFAQAGVEGTFVACRQPDGVMTGHNAERAITPLPPASTFKIPHVLIALEVGAISGTGEMFAWRGEPRRFGSWERDMTLAEAFATSNLHVFGEVAARIGRERLQAGLKAYEYGNRAVGDSLADFWLVGPLEISAVEQCRFLLRLAAGQVPVSDQHLQVLRRMMGSEVGQGVRLYAKTGWASAPEPGPGWWVGWIEGPFGLAAFALNIDLPDATHAPLRVDIGSRALRILGLLP